MIDQPKILSRSQVPFSTLFFGGALYCVAAFTSHGKVHEFGSKEKLIS
jgi:hypothetical protein